MPAPNPRVHAVYLQLAPGDIALAKFIFESYEEVGIVRTLDRRTAVIVVLVVDDLLPDARAILADLCTMIACTEVAAPPGDADDWLMRELQAAEGDQ